MIEGRPSHTALRVATHRAAHQLLDTPVVFHDPLALAILGPEAAAGVRANPGGSERSIVGPYLRAFLAARSRVAEDTLQALHGARVTQYVVLGAGLDTFAYRNPYMPSSLRIFEVDHPSTQEWKRNQLAAAGIPLPPNLTFVSVDFERQSLRAQLEYGGLRADEGTCFAWLGVTPYLTRDAIDETLAIIADFCRLGGGVVFDYAVPPETLGIAGRAVVTAMATRVKRIGEEWKSWIVPEQIVRQMRDLGFNDVVDLDGVALNARYFAGRSDGLRVGDAAHVLRAVRR